MKTTHKLLLAVALGFLATSLPACDATSDTPADSGVVADAGAHPVDGGLPVDGGPHDAGIPDAGEPSCFTNPTSHYELINGCTDSVAIDKTPVLPGLIDGGLPPLP